MSITVLDTPSRMNCRKLLLLNVSITQTSTEVPAYPNQVETIAVITNSTIS
jgi:hypothetical protein